MSKKLLLRGIWSLGLILLLVGLVSVGIGAKGCERAFNKDDDDDPVIISGSSAAVTAPSGLAADPVSSTAVALTWTDNANNETGFKLERKTGVGGAYGQVADIAVANTTAYTDTTATAANVYYYQLKAYESTDSLESNYSSAVGTLTHGLWSATTMTDTTPISRAGHTQVWTGSEMIAWGGFNGSVYLNTGGVYSPTINTWTAITTYDAPVSRTGHTAIWTGTKMVVWGGYADIEASSQTITNCESAWVAAAGNITTATSTDKHEGVFSSSIEIASAFTPDNIAYADFAPINISNKTQISFWIKVTQSLGSGVLKLLLDDDAGCPSPLEEISIAVDLAPGVWTPVILDISSPSKLTQVASVGLKAASDPGEVTIFIDEIEALAEGITYYNSGGIYDPAIKDWTPMDTANAPVARAFHTAIWTGSKMVVWGGKNASTKYKDGGVFDPNTNEWRIGSYPYLNAGTHANNPAIRYEHLAAWTGPGTESWNNKMIVWGGTGNGTAGLNTGAIYDMVLDTWTTMGTDNAPSGRWRFSSVWTDAGANSWNNKLIVWGGYNGTAPLDDGATYDPATNAWTTLPTTNAPSARMYHSAVWTGSRMIIWGGDGIKQVGGVYDPANTSWYDTSITGAPTARVKQIAVWDATNGFMIIWGGWDGSDYLYTGGRYTAQ